MLRYAKVSEVNKMNDIIIKDNIIENKIFSIRDLQVMLDADLAQLYEVETKRINEAVKNNPDKFPDDFYFELTKEEDEILRSKFSTFKENLKINVGSSCS